MNPKRSIRARCVALALALTVPFAACSSSGSFAQGDHTDAVGLGLKLLDGATFPASRAKPSRAVFARWAERAPGAEGSELAYYALWCAWVVDIHHDTPKADAAKTLKAAKAAVEKEGWAQYYEPEETSGMGVAWMGGEPGALDSFVRTSECHDLYPETTSPSTTS